jgi:hypothetical protein
MSFFDFLRRPRPAAPVAQGPAPMTRTQAAVLLAAALRKGGPFFCGVYAPRGDAGRVAVPIVLVLRRQAPVRLGWIDVLLNGSIVLDLDESAVASQVAAVIEAVAKRVCQAIRVQPVRADPRTWTRGLYRVRQAPNGLWTLDESGVVRAAGNTFEEAIALAAGAGGAATSLQPAMDPSYAARWLAAALREAGHSAWSDGQHIILATARGPDCRVRIAGDGTGLPDDCPEPQRSLIAGALRAVRIVEHLE